jgi:hypothetical protein
MISLFIRLCGAVSRDAWFYVMGPDIIPLLSDQALMVEKTVGGDDSLGVDFHCIEENPMWER